MGMYLHDRGEGYDLISLRPPILRLRDLSRLSGLAGLANRDAIEVRKRYPIAILDDRPETIYSNLKTRGFNIAEFRSFTELATSVGSYSIFICDIKDVAPESSNDGVYAIEEIRKASPLSYIICYTNMSINDRRTVLANRVSDEFIKKPVDVAEFIRSLDEAIKLMSSPIGAWNRMRAHLIDQNASSIELALLEHYWVRAIMKGDPKIFRKGLKKIEGRSDLELSSVLRKSVVYAIEVGAESVAKTALGAATGLP